MRRRFEEPVEKPYDFVEFPSNSPEYRRGEGHHKASADHLSGWFMVELFTLRPVQVASGITDFVRTQSGEKLTLTNVSVPRQKPTGKTRTYLLPGSSLKGVARSLVEAISLSCVPQSDYKVRSFLPKRFGKCTKPERLCPACRLFGAQDYQGQVAFEDAEAPPGNLQVWGVPLLWTPARSRRRGLPRRYLKGNEAAGRKFYKHGQVAKGPERRMTIKEGIAIPTRISFENLTKAELGLLIAALGNHPDYPFPIKVGAGKPIGMGSVEVRFKTAVLLSGAQGVKAAGRLGGATEKLEGEELKERLKQWTQVAQEEKLLLIEQLDELKTVLREENLSQPSPSVY